ncbi:hypothetical protein CcaverHIS002_0211090 [Cutaneotrichosporon cavernicola]|uniref:DUF1764-domain-containing protein n=1 Tax=Cutaneotrichosporon cavernicola TaxID=279322 RepID=A0AA48IBG8_9TREE|nr:uncharacterized protein CcaverHIS019_0211090 [Cutaneotrichosporon cavernicola]BEI81949.1 hypothetical protein CcaverHIS002_0211090 [Cutaneotrichosporon cavernicola]BEI89747.1 hypothetical protein CcaverHIS019_0211090 [Cutaneotrichosporon cavernicola]BEI97518.1 hypothetical protein CcaverHIS631_0211070 [Cutaneotrichosporon cavernicola]BEJ05296.1 hypothetical protein CcaverHIS641_0211130 [Cutaneotrichosporon cavernicola]
MSDKKDKGKKKAVVVDAGEIDDIFAAPKAVKSKAKGKKRDEGRKVEEAAKRSEMKDKVKKSKKSGEKPNKKEKENKTQQSSVVEEVVDPSVAVVAALDRAKEARAGNAGKRDRTEVEQDRLWRDSRGDGDRQRTEEGYLIFKEAELGIDPEVGGTPLCPFDCDCCF